MTTLSAVGARLNTLLRSRIGIRFSRYTVASLVAVGIGYVVFLTAYGPGNVPPGAASIIAFVAGALPKYVLNRAWAWQRRGRPRLGREMLPYAAIVTVSAVAAAVTTDVADFYLPRLVESHNLQVLLVGGVFVVTNGVMFVAKFVLFDRLVFSDRPPPSPPSDGSPTPARL